MTECKQSDTLVVMEPTRNADWDLVLSTRAALEAFEQGQHDPHVTGFRERWLPSGLLPPRWNAVRRWLDEVANGALPTGPDSAKAAGLEGLARAMRKENRHPASGVPPEESTVPVDVSVGFWIPDAQDDDWFFVRPVPPQGLLGELLWLGWHLADRFGWDAAHARGWVVCEGALPVVHAIRLRSGSIVEPETPNASRYRVLLDVSLDAPPARVDQELRQLQAARADSGRESSVPARPIAEWNLRVTLFAVTRNDGRSWADVLEEWNASEPSWHYREDVRGAQLLGNTVHRTYAVLMGRPLAWQRKAGARRSK